MSALLLIEQLRERGEQAPWVLEAGRVLRGHESARRIARVREGLLRNRRVSATAAVAAFPT